MSRCRIVATLANALVIDISRSIVRDVTGSSPPTRSDPAVTSSLVPSARVTTAAAPGTAPPATAASSMP